MTTNYRGVDDSFIDQLRPRIGGYPVYIQRGMGYDEAVVLDRSKVPSLAEPVVLVNGPNYLRLIHPGLGLWEAIDMWIREKVIAPMVEDAIMHVHDTALLEEKRSEIRVIERARQRRRPR